MRSFFSYGWLRYFPNLLVSPFQPFIVFSSSFAQPSKSTFTRQPLRDFPMWMSMTIKPARTAASVAVALAFVLMAVALGMAVAMPLGLCMAVAFMALVAAALVAVAFMAVAMGAGGLMAVAVAATMGLNVLVVMILQGHDAWIRPVAMVPAPDSPRKRVYSCSQSHRHQSKLSWLKWFIHSMLALGWNGGLTSSCWQRCDGKDCPCLWTLWARLDELRKALHGSKAEKSGQMLNTCSSIQSWGQWCWVRGYHICSCHPFYLLVDSLFVHKVKPLFRSSWDQHCSSIKNDA